MDEQEQYSFREEAERQEDRLEEDNNYQDHREE